MQNPLYELERNENEFASAMLARHSRELEAIDAALSQIFAGFKEFRSRKGILDQRLETGRIILVVRSFNSLLCAKRTLERGYTEQALALARMAMEDQLVAEDIEVEPTTLDALLLGKGEIGIGDLHFTNLANRLPKEEIDLWKNDYRIASRYGTHPGHNSGQWLISPAQDGQKFLGMGSFFYSGEDVNTVLYFLLLQLVKVMWTLRKVTDQVGSDWGTHSGPEFEEVFYLWELKLQMGSQPTRRDSRMTSNIPQFNIF